MSAASSGPLQLPAALNKHTICLLLWSGLYLWEIIRAMPFNWSVVSGARGCRWGAYVLYFPLRSLVLLSFAFGITGIFPPQWQPKSVLTLHYTGEVMNMVARLLVYHILTIDIAALWNTRKAAYPVVGAMLAVWTISIYCICRIRSNWGATIMLKVFTLSCLCLTTAIFVLFVVGIGRAHKRNRLNALNRSGSPFSMWHILLAVRAHFMVLIWLAQVIDSATRLGLGRSDTAQAIGVTCYIVIIVCGCRSYQHMVKNADVCPMSSSPCLISTVVRARNAKLKTSDFSDSTYSTRRSQEGDPQPSSSRAQRTRASTSVRIVPAGEAIELDTFSRFEASTPSVDKLGKRPMTGDSASSAGPSLTSKKGRLP